jgi:hypothetical protein
VDLPGLRVCLQLGRGGSDRRRHHVDPSRRPEQAALARAHFIVDDARDIAADLAGVRPSLDLDDDQVVQILREWLPTEGGWRLVPNT